MSKLSHHNQDGTRVCFRTWQGNSISRTSSSLEAHVHFKNSCRRNGALAPTSPAQRSQLTLVDCIFGLAPRFRAVATALPLVDGARLCGPWSGSGVPFGGVCVACFEDAPRSAGGRGGVSSACEFWRLMASWLCVRLRRHPPGPCRSEAKLDVVAVWRATLFFLSWVARDGQPTCCDGSFSSLCPFPHAAREDWQCDSALTMPEGFFDVFHHKHVVFCFLSFFATAQLFSSNSFVFGVFIFLTERQRHQKRSDSTCSLQSAA